MAGLNFGQKVEQVAPAAQAGIAADVAVFDWTGDSQTVMTEVIKSLSVQRREYITLDMSAFFTRVALMKGELSVPAGKTQAGLPRASIQINWTDPSDQKAYVFWVNVVRKDGLDRSDAISIAQAIQAGLVEQVASQLDLLLTRQWDEKSKSWRTSAMFGRKK